MSKFFCINCGEAISYSINKPEACPSCKHNFGQTIKVERSSEVSSAPVIVEPELDFDKLQVIVDEAPKPVMIQDLAYQRRTGPISNRQQGPGGGVKVLEEIQNELRPIK